MRFYPGTVIALVISKVLVCDFCVEAFMIDPKKTTTTTTATTTASTIIPKYGIAHNERPISISPHKVLSGRYLSSSFETKSYSTSSSSSKVPLQLSGGGANGDVTSPSKPKPFLLREMIAEFIGTFLIVQIGCGTVCAAVFQSAQVGLWQIAVAWSIAVTLAICTTASISGAHLNPAITLSMAIFRKFPLKKMLPFVAAQLGGAISGAGVNLMLYGDNILQFESAKNIVRGSVESVQSALVFGEYWSVSNWMSAFFAEAYGSAILAFAVFALTSPRNETTSKHPFLIPPLIGLTVAALISVIAPLTQAGFNPARDFGPRIVACIAGWGSVAMKGWWLYVVAPLIGAPLGAWVADKVLYAESDE